MLNEYLNQLKKEERVLQERLQECQIKIRGIEVFQAGKREEISSLKSKQLRPTIIKAEENDEKKIDLFLELLDKCGENVTSRELKKKVPRSQYYIYSDRARLWENGFQEFMEDYHNWLNLKGHWAYLKPTKEE